MEEPARNKVRAMLGELLENMEDAQEVANGLAREYPEYRAMAEAVHRVKDIVLMACELEAYDERESNEF
jgi:hypothetical protein